MPEAPYNSPNSKYFSGEMLYCVVLTIQFCILYSWSVIYFENLVVYNSQSENNSQQIILAPIIMHLQELTHHDTWIYLGRDEQRFKKFKYIQKFTVQNENVMTILHIIFEMFWSILAIIFFSFSSFKYSFPTRKNLFLNFWNKKKSIIILFITLKEKMCVNKTNYSSSHNYIFQY